MVVKEKTTTRPLKATASKEAPFGVPKKRTTPQREKHQPVSGTKKSVIIKPTKAREPKNGFVVITNNVQKKKPSQKISRTVSTSVLPMPAILSPFRFPMLLSTNALVLVARVFGIAFIGVGSFLTFMNLPIADSLHQSTPQYSETASTGDALLQTTTPPPTTNTSSGSGSFDTTPEPHISIAGTRLSGNVTITVGVSLASGVKILLQNKSTNQLMTLGYATRIDDNTWSFIWNTTGFMNGEYRLKVLITNQYESYDYADSTVYEVQNSITTTTQEPQNPPTNQPATTTSGSSSSTPPVPDSNTTVSFSVNDVTTSGNDTQFSIEAQSASRVTVHAQNISSNVLYYVGQASLLETNKWQLLWKSSNIPDGTYYFFAQAVINGQTFKSATKKISLSKTTTLPASTTSPTGTDTTPLQTTVTGSEALKPSISLSLQSENPVSGFSEISIVTSPVLWVELYAIPKNSLTSQFLGLASKKSDTSWTYSWNTAQVPNGDYTVHARVKTSYGFTEGSRTNVRVLNQINPTYTEAQEAQIDSLQSASTELTTVTDNPNTEDSKEIYIEPVTAFVEKLEVSDDVITELDTTLTAFRKDLDVLLTEYARAKRTGDAEALKTVEQKFESLKDDLIKKLPANIEKKEVLDQINTYITQIVFDLRELTSQNETMLKERVGDAVIKDSDNDGISDYDEVHLYKTSPFTADTDGDGHIDGSEIALGYDPHDSSVEALVTYKSPLDSGIVRDDLLSIEEIVTLTPDAEGDTPKAVVSGKGLPNSFVTLFIYSTPIVVTVKTDTDGNWSYIFDKELENGEHEIYVGIIDNTGEIVAKSNSFAFAKTAEAFTEIDPRTAVAHAEEIRPSFTNDKTLLIVGSMVVVFLGLILIFIGIHSQRSKKTLADTLVTS